MWTDVLHSETVIHMSSEHIAPTPLPPSPIALMLCPLCFEESGERIAIVAEYRSEPIVTVAHLVGCQHGVRFGEPDGLTFADRQRMTQAALKTWAIAQQMMYAFLPCRDRGVRCGADRPRCGLRPQHRTPR